MSKLRFKYATMNSGKSTALLQSAHNLKSIGKEVRYFTSALDNRYGVGKITSRIGIEADAVAIPKDDFSVLQSVIDEIYEGADITALYIDECQFLSTEQVDFLADIVDNCGVDVHCYGLRTDFEGNLFEGSKRLFEIADKLSELHNFCTCGKTAIMNARLVQSTDQVFIGGNDDYQSVCRLCHKKHVGKQNGYHQ